MERGANPGVGPWGESVPPLRYCRTGWSVRTLGGVVNEEGTRAGEAIHYAINPVGFAMVLIGAAIAVIGTFLPRAETTTFTLSGIEKNTLIQSGGGVAIIVGAVILALVAYSAWSSGRRSWAILLISAYLIGQAFYQGSGDRIALYRIDQFGNQGQQVDASAGIGIYAVGVGGFLGLLGGWIIRRSSLPLTEDSDITPNEEEPMKRCPDCAELVLAAARVCKHCRHEFSKEEILPVPGANE